VKSISALRVPFERATRKNFQQRIFADETHASDVSKRTESPREDASLRSLRVQEVLVACRFLTARAITRDIDAVCRSNDASAVAMRNRRLTSRRATLFGVREIRFFFVVL
jgi:hypothetical protein